MSTQCVGCCNDLPCPKCDDWIESCSECTRKDATIRSLRSGNDKLKSTIDYQLVTTDTQATIEKLTKERDTLLEYAKASDMRAKWEDCDECDLHRCEGSFDNGYQFCNAHSGEIARLSEQRRAALSLCEGGEKTNEQQRTCV